MKLILHVLLLFLSQALSSAHHHPLDPLTPSELTTVTNIIKSSHLGTSKTLTFHHVGLDEPDKPLVLSYLSNPSNTQTPLPRRAFVIARSEEQTHEIYVDITDKSIISDHIYEGFGFPVLGLDEQFAASLLPLNYAPFIESVRKRGVDIKNVVCSTFTVGWFGEVKQGKRTIKILCFLTGDTVNLYVMPLEGITVVVDLDAMEIVEYKDRLVVPVPKSAGTDYRWSKQKPPFEPQVKPVTVVQPDGKGFEIDGHMISEEGTSGNEGCGACFNHSRMAGEVKQWNRTIKVLCFLTGDKVNLYVRPSEGYTVVMDLDGMEIVKYKDRLLVPVPKSARMDYRWSKQKPPFGLQTKSPSQWCSSKVRGLRLMAI